MAAAAEAGSLRLDLERSANAPSIARDAIRDLCERGGLSGESCEMLLLLVSEVVTNAVVHSNAPAAQPIAFSAQVRHGRVRVQVADGGRGFPPGDGVRASGGWGLRLLQNEAARWGVDTERGTSVWFELPVGG